jgi:hypothetical protein
MWCEESNAQGKITSVWIILKTRLFQAFFGPIQTFGQTVPRGPSTAERQRRTRFAADSNDSLQDRLEAVPRKREVRQLWLLSPQEKIVRGGNIQQIGQLMDHPDAFAAI